MLGVDRRSDAGADEAGHTVDVDGPYQCFAEAMRDRGHVVCLSQ